MCPRVHFGNVCKSILCILPACLRPGKNNTSNVTPRAAGLGRRVYKQIRMPELIMILLVTQKGSGISNLSEERVLLGVVHRHHYILLTSTLSGTIITRHHIPRA
jgi:hypothetical protein